jgi:flagellar L-ring protein FlgH
MKRTLFGALVIAGVLGGCGPQHVRPFTPRERVYKEGAYAARSAAAKSSNGSLWSDASGGYLEDTRAVRVGDVVTIRVGEHADARGGATTKLSKGASREAGVDALLGLVPAIQKAYPNIDPTRLIELMASSDFTGDGQTRRAGQLTARIAVRVVRELPNGDLFVEGTKVVLINQEEYHLYVSGVARPSDIEPDNSVDSARLADAQVEFTGRGDVADQVDRGFLTKLLDSINPF